MKPISKMLQLLLPHGIAWKKQANSPFTIATGKSLEQIKEYIDNLLPESMPGRAVQTLEKWHEEAGIIYNPNESLNRRQTRVAVALAFGGNQSPDYLIERIQQEFPDIEVLENTAPSGQDTNDYYALAGSVDTLEQQSLLLTLVEKIMPLHLAIQELYIVATVIDRAVCGIGRVGIMRTGAQIGEW